MYGKIAILLIDKLYKFNYSENIDHFVNELLDYGKYYDADACNIYIIYKNKRYKLSVDLCYNEVPGSLCRVFTNFGYDNELVYGYNNRRPSLKTIIKLLKAHKYFYNRLEHDKETKRISDTMFDKVPTWSKDFPFKFMSSIFKEELYLVKDGTEYCLIWVCKENGNTKIIHAGDYSIYTPKEFCNDNMFYYGPIVLNSIKYPDFNSSIEVESINEDSGKIKLKEIVSKKFTIDIPSVV